MLDRRACVHPYHPWSGKIYIQRYTKTCLKSHISSISLCLPLSLFPFIYIYIYLIISSVGIPLRTLDLGTWELEKLAGCFPQKVCQAINSIAWNSLKYSIEIVFFKISTNPKKQSVHHPFRMFLYDKICRNIAVYSIPTQSTWGVMEEADVLSIVLGKAEGTCWYHGESQRMRPTPIPPNLLPQEKNN